MSLPRLAPRVMARRIVAVAAIAGLVTPLLPSPASAAEPTGFAFRASGYSTLVRGGGLPIDSGPTAFVTLPCTSQSGITKQNGIASSNPDTVPVDTGVSETTLQSKPMGNGFASTADNTVLRTKVGDAVAFLEVRGLRTYARSAFFGGLWRPYTQVTISSAQFVVAGVSRTPVTLDQLRNGFPVPGIAEVSIGDSVTDSGPDFALAQATGLRVRLLGAGLEGAEVIVGHVETRLDSGLPSGVFSGESSVGRVTTTSGVLQSGPIMVIRHPCLSTNGVWRERSLADAELGDVGDVQGARVRIQSAVRNTYSYTRSEAYVDSAELLDGSIEIEDLVVKAFVRRNLDGTYQKDSIGTTVGKITVEGNVIELPDPGDTVTVPGVVSITFHTVQRPSLGIRVYGLRLQLLDGSGLNVELGKATGFIR